jgi:hypothetical protein
MIQKSLSLKLLHYLTSLQITLGLQFLDKGRHPVWAIVGLHYRLMGFQATSQILIEEGECVCIHHTSSLI